jgi:hypothetical protein
MSQIKDVFFRNIEEDIAPVIYFHQLDPEIVSQEVREYVFTESPNIQGHQIGGIHEQMVSLINNICTAIEEGHKLPASWISGFFGSGKSSFAKLVGLSLDKLKLPDGTTIDSALLQRNDTKKAYELREAFNRLNTLIDCMAVIFDIGTSAKNNESIPHTIYRQILSKLGYSQHDGVAHFELALEDEGRYEEFLERYQEQYEKPWTEKRNSALAPQQFRTIYKTLYPEQDDLLEITTFNLRSLSIYNMVSNLYKIIERRAPGRTIFIVVDEVSQYIAKDQNKMLDLQSFVSEIGGRAKPNRSQLWLLVTGQEKLEEENKESVLFKLKDRFPPELRIHLDRTNVREIVGRRLLKKRANTELEVLLDEMVIDNIKLHAYECANVTKEQLIDNYPLLPAHIPLFMDITQSIRDRSAKTQSDAGGVRSVLNNIWDLFNREPVALKNKQSGTLMTLDMLYDIIGSSIDSDVQITLHKIFEKHGFNEWKSKVVKAIALLEMNAEKLPVHPSVIAALLYPHFGSPSVEVQVQEALDVLNKENWISFHEKHGWHIQNNAAQEWNTQKKDISVSPGKIFEIIIKLQTEIVATVAQPTLTGARFPWECYWGLDQKLVGKGDPTNACVSFHWESNSSKRKDLDSWLNLSRTDKNRFHWVSGDINTVHHKVIEYERSQKMIERCKNRGPLSHQQQSLLYREQAVGDSLLDEIKKDLRQVWVNGILYFNGDLVEMNKAGSSFENSMKTEIENRLGQLYYKFKQGYYSISEQEYSHLLLKDTSGLGIIFFENFLGIAHNDGGKIGFRCDGQVPKEVFQFLEEHSYQTGEQLLRYFGSAPYGYSPIVIKACIIGLLREERLRISGSNKNEITSISDPGANAVFEQHREFIKAEIEINRDDSLTGRDRNQIRKFFESRLQLEGVESESDKLADLVFKHFPPWKDRVTELQKKINSFGFKIPSPLNDFNQALTECINNRQILATLKRVKQNLEILQDGVERVKELEDTLNQNTEQELRRLKHTLEQEVFQLEQVFEKEPIQSAMETLANHLSGNSPWRGYADVKPYAEEIQKQYRQIRVNLNENQISEFERSITSIKIRSEFSSLNDEQQQQVLQQVYSVFTDIDDDAVQPTLLVIKQQPNRIREAAARAHELIDQLVNESNEQPSPEEPPKPKIHTVRLGLRNRVITNKDELETVLQHLKEKCLKELDAGIKVRFEE